VLYHSQKFGNTEAMAEALAQGARQNGAEVIMVNTNNQRLDIEDYRKVDAAAFGSPDYYSYIAGGLKVFLDDWYIANTADPTSLTGKPIALFYSHGGGGRVRQPLESLFKRLGEQAGQTVESKV
jgi:NAD(P)H dehydrogenase (quinone)